jgi:ketosteroid isomerase-like protein
MIKDLFSGSVVPGKGATRDGVSDTTAAATVTPGPTDKTPPSKPPALTKADTEAVLAAVNDWAKAWSVQDADAYLDHYAPAFQVPGGEPRAAWEATRRDRIAKPKSIEVTVGSPKVSFNANGQATVSFRQGYKSDTLNTSGAKTLTLTKINDRWRIVQERMN